MLTLIALGREPDPPLSAAMPDPVERSEYNRLTQELELLAAKRAWVGAERIFQALLSTGADPSFADWLRGAHAARAAGDLLSTRQRLASAQQVRHDPAVQEWIIAIDNDYGRVRLACDPGSRIQLLPEALPLDPDQRRAVERAVAQIHEGCAFDGLLPRGSYRFYTQSFRVIPRVQTVWLDLRGARIDRKLLKELQGP